MAVFSWISDLQGRALRDCLQPIVAELDLRIDEEYCSDRQLYAVDRSDGPVPLHARVKVLATWSCSQGLTCQVEVRSSEPQLRHDTRCEQVARQLRQLLPPLAAA